MPIHLSWDNPEKNIILAESAGKWTWEEYHEALTQIAEMMRSVNYRVDLVNVRQADSMRPAGSAMPHYQRAMRVLPNNAGLNVIVNTSMIARTMVTIFLRLYGSRKSGLVMLAASLEDARTLIAKDREKTRQGSKG